MKMNIMKSSWIDEVWKENQNDNLPATSPHFDAHKVPEFFNLRVTTTGLTRREKKDVEDIVKNGGGIYHGEFSSTSIDIVIAKKDATMTPKIQAAINQKKDCLSVEWIRDSAKARYSLPLDEYRIDLQPKKHTSTPEKRTERSQFYNTTTADISNISVGTINETAMSNLSISSDRGSNSRKRKSNDAGNENKDMLYKAVFDKLNVQEAKRAGTFLDGCNVRNLLIIIIIIISHVYKLTLYLHFSDIHLWILS